MNNNSNNEGERITMANGTIRTMEAFAETVKSAMEAVYGNRYSIHIHPVAKNNGTHLTGITIREKGINIAPTIYLEGLYAKYQDGMSMAAVCQAVMDIYGQHKETQDFDSSVVTDFDQARDRICFMLVNAGKNRGLLDGIPYMPYHDLAVVFYILVSKDAGGLGTVLVNNRFMEMWGADLQAICPIAMENTQRIFRGRVQSMGSMMAEFVEDMLDAEDSKEFYDMAAATEDDFPMYIASNYGRFNGASVLLYPNLLRNFAERIGSGFYILPSSVHELIFVPETEGTCVEELKTMVMEVNHAEVAEDEILSYNVYFYNRAYDRVEIV